MRNWPYKTPYKDWPIELRMEFVAEMKEGVQYETPYGKVLCPSRESQWEPIQERSNDAGQTGSKRNKYR